MSDLYARAGELLEQAKRGVADEADQEVHRARYRRFTALRNEALFHDTQFTGLDLPSNQEASRRSVHDALAFVRDPRSQRFLGAGSTPSGLLLRPPTERDRGGDHLSPLGFGPSGGRARSGSANPRPGRAAPSADSRSFAASGMPGQEATLKRRERASRGRALPPDSAFDYFLTGQRALQAGRVGCRFAHFDAALSFAPDHFWAHCLASAICAAQAPAAELARAHDGLLTSRARLRLALRAPRLRLGTDRGRGALPRRNPPQLEILADVEGPIPGCRGRLPQGGCAARCHAPNSEIRHVLLVNRGLLGLGDGGKKRRRTYETRSPLMATRSRHMRPGPGLQARTGRGGCRAVRPGNRRTPRLGRGSPEDGRMFTSA